MCMTIDSVYLIKAIIIFYFGQTFARLFDLLIKYNYIFYIYI